MNLRKLTAVIVAVLMMVSMMPLTAFAEMGEGFPWNDEQSLTLVEQIIERDGFIDGIWFPWFHGGTVGHNLTSNELIAEYYDVKGGKEAGWNYVELDSYGADSVYRDIYNLKSMGYNMLAYGGSIMAEGVVFDANGDVIGIKEEYLANARRLLDMCREIGMPIMWNVYFHCSSMPDYYGIDGWKVMCQMLGNNEIADHYAERFVRPLCEMLTDYQDVVAIVSIADEPENEINDIGIGDHYEGIRAMYGVNQDDMVYFMQQINETVRDVLPEMPRTVASNSGNKAIYRDFDLDLMGHNQYTDNPDFKTIESMISDADMIMTEYNVGNIEQNDEEYANKLIAFRQDLMSKGYKGGFQWCWMRGSSVNTPYALQRDSEDETSFRKTVTLLKRYIDQYRADYRGEAITLDAPVLYANMGDGQLLWIPSEKATAITIQRSDDGGNNWITLESNVNQNVYVDEYLVGRYTDDDATRPTSGYCYRIIATNGSSTVDSAPNNVAGTMDKFINKDYVDPEITDGIFYQPTTGKTESDAKLTSFGVEKNRPAFERYNLIQNGTFEADGGQWNTASFLQYATVVTDPTTVDGDKSLYFDTSSQLNADWYAFTVDVEPHTNYTFSTFIKGAYLADDNKGFGSIGVIDPDTGMFMVEWKNYKDYARSSRETQQIYPTAWDDEWHLRAVSFNSGNATEVTIALYGYSSKMWVDGLALFESSNGVKYVNGESAKAITSTQWEDLSDSGNNAVADSSINNTAYWSSGAGYKQGFVNANSGKLTYTASTHPVGVRYTKWVDVKPNTDYYYSFTVNVSDVGGGRFAILDNAKALPNEAVIAPFSSVGTTTYTGCISTGTYDQLGLCVVDLGGVASIDNVTLYEAGESTPVVTEPSFDGYIVNGNFEIGSYENWENLWGDNTVNIVPGQNGGYAIQVDAGAWTHVRQFVTVKPNTDYIIELYTKNASYTSLLIKDGDDTVNIAQTSMNSGSDWTKISLEFNSRDNNQIIVSLMGDTADAVYTVDNVTMRTKYVVEEEEEDTSTSLLSNGDFESGNSNYWENLWDSNTVTMVDGHDSVYGMKVNADMYTVVRQKVTVEKNTDYVISLWSKNSVNGSLLIKDSADSQNIVNQALNAGSAWVKTTVEFNSGNNEYVFVGFMGGADGSSYVVDDVVMTKKVVSESGFGVVNGGFEDGTDGWTFASGTNAIVSDAHSGNNAIQLTNPGMWASAAEQIIAVDSNTDYTITWWYKASYGTGIFNLYVMNANGYANLEPIESPNYRNYMSNYNNQWQKVTYAFNTGEATSIVLKFSTEVYEPGTVIIDDVTMQKLCLHVYDHSCDDTCNLCGEVREVYHDYWWYTIQEQTCIHTGIYLYKCGGCGDSYTEEIPAIGYHVYDSYVSQSATCGANGIRVYECLYYDHCGAWYTEVIPATGTHAYSGVCDSSCDTCGATRTAPHRYSGTCDTYCDLCYSYRSTNVGHTYSYVCDDTCNVCNSWRSVEHNYVERERDEPNCGFSGYIYYQCNICYNAGYYDSLPATGNHRMDGVSIVQEPTCSQDGERLIYCTVCDNEGYFETIPSTGEHSYRWGCDTNCKYCGDLTRPDATHTWVDDGCAYCHERLFNGDFELGWDYWSCWDEVVDQHEIVTDAHSGNYALQLSGVKQYDESAAQIIDVLPNTQYTVSWWYKAAPDSGAYHLFIMNADGWANLTHDGYMNWYTGEWQQKTVVFNTGSATSIMLKFSTGNAFNSDVILIDDVTVKSQYDLCNHSLQITGMETPTCTTDGVYYYYCDLCGGDFEEVIRAEGHSYYTEEYVAPTCTTDGYVTYVCDNWWLDYCGDRYTTVIPATCALTATYVPAKEATCVGAGNIAYWHCVHCGSVWLDADCTRSTSLSAVTLPTIDHVYDHDFDTDCADCGGIREVSLPIAFGGNSISEDVSGLAFRFSASVQGMDMNVTTAVYDNATMNGYRVLALGAVVTNGMSSVDVPVVYLCGLTADACDFGVRIIHIPDNKYDVSVTATPYVVLEVDGVATRLYGEPQTASFNSVLNK